MITPESRTITFTVWGIFAALFVILVASSPSVRVLALWLVFLVFPFVFPRLLVRHRSLMIYTAALFLLLLPVAILGEVAQNKNTSNPFAFLPMFSFHVASFFLFVGAAVQLFRLGYFYSVPVPILTWVFMVLLTALTIPAATFLGIDVHPHFQGG